MSRVNNFKGTNEEQKLFIFKSGEGITCWGYQNAIDETWSLQEYFRETPDVFVPGNIAVLAKYDELMARVAAEGGIKLTWFNRHTPSKVCHALERARLGRWIVRLWLGDPETGKRWDEENDVVGRVSRSTGLLKIPLLIELDGDGMGGGAISDHRVLRIDRWSRATPTHQKEEILYKHPKFELPVTEIRDEGVRKKPRYSVLLDGEVFGCENTQIKAERLAAFMRGDIIIK